MDSIAISRCKGVYRASEARARVGLRQGLVSLSIGNKVAYFKTPQAVEAGLALVRQAALLEPGEFMNLCINGQDIHLLGEHATSLGGALLRKADAADDWQLTLKRA